MGENVSRAIATVKPLNAIQSQGSATVRPKDLLEITVRSATPPIITTVTPPIKAPVTVSPSTEKTKKN